MKRNKQTMTPQGILRSFQKGIVKYFAISKMVQVVTQLIGYVVGQPKLTAQCSLKPKQRETNLKNKGDIPRDCVYAEIVFFRIPGDTVTIKCANGELMQLPCSRKLDPQTYTINAMVNENYQCKIYM